MIRVNSEGVAQGGTASRGEVPREYTISFGIFSIPIYIYGSMHMYIYRDRIVWGWWWGGGVGWGGMGEG